MHASGLAVEAPEIDENEDSEVIQFINRHVTHALTDDTRHPEISNLVNKLQTWNHTTLAQRKIMQCIDLMLPGNHEIRLEQFVLRRRQIKLK